MAEKHVRSSPSEFSFFFCQGVIGPQARIVLAIVVFLKHFPGAIGLHLVFREVGAPVGDVRAFDVQLAVAHSFGAGVIAGFIAI